MTRPRETKLIRSLPRHQAAQRACGLRHGTKGLGPTGEPEIWGSFCLGFRNAKRMELSLVRLMF